MSLKLTPATGDWGLSPSAELSPVDMDQFQDALKMARELSCQVEGFVQAASARAIGEDTSSDAFIKKWEVSFKRCLNQFGAKYSLSEDVSDHEDCYSDAGASPNDRPSSK